MYTANCNMSSRGQASEGIELVNSQHAGIDFAKEASIMLELQGSNDCMNRLPFQNVREPAGG